MPERCTARASLCACQNEDCDGTHVCDCGASWSGDIKDGTFRAIILPGMTRESTVLLGAILGIPMDPADDMEGN